MNNFNICYNALCRAFDKENAIIPPTLVEILKPQNPVDSSIIHTNTNDDEAECRTTTNSEDFSDDESDGSDNIDSKNINQINLKSRTNDKSADTPKSLSRSFSTLAITTNANSLNLPLSSIKLTIKPNPLGLPHDQKQRQEIDYKLNQLIFGHLEHDENIKIDVDVSLYLSIERFKDSRVIDEISKKVKDILEKQGRTTRTSSIIKASKNIDSLLLSKRKGTVLTFLSVYLSVNVAESLNDTVVPTVSSDENALETSVGDDDDSINSDSSRPFSPSTSHDSLSSDISFYMCNDIMKTNA
ncbi:unnamed protein product [Rotaria socialis]|uniref:Uncharacterized protein n=2 Tax=Rotaria socialis TaxID=392032 RepID=A0A820YX25_9BILA|nr:unnamed protein product [Rotaria socialis]